MDDELCSKSKRLLLDNTALGWVRVGASVICIVLALHIKVYYQAPSSNAVTPTMAPSARRDFVVYWMILACL